MTMNQIRENARMRALVDSQKTVAARFEMESVRLRLVQAGAAYRKLTEAMQIANRRFCDGYASAHVLRFNSVLHRRNRVDREITRLALRFSDMERRAF